MHRHLDWREIAARVRGLIPESEFGDLTDTAHRLGVKELDLYLAVDRHAPRQSLDVLAAIVNTYGVDPCWLLYGDYNCETHRRALEEGATRDNLFRLAHRSV